MNRDPDPKERLFEAEGVDPIAVEEPQPVASLKDGSGSRTDELLREAMRRVRAVDPRAFLVEARVIRRVIKAEVALPALSVQIPHRKTWLARRNTLMRHVEPDELGIEPSEELPEVAILLQRPEEGSLDKMELDTLLNRSWRLLYHARIDYEFRERFQHGLLDQAKIRARIHRLGQAEFDEIYEVLRHEAMLQEESTVPDAYAEFVAVYCELLAFAPHCIPAYFPSLQDPERVRNLLSEDIDIDLLLDATRPKGAADAVSREDRSAHDETDAELDYLTGRAAKAGLTSQHPDSIRLRVPRTVKTAPRTVKRRQKRAERSAARGNSVAAALLLVSAARHAPEDQARVLCDAAESHLRRLVERLQAALNFEDETRARWYRSVVGLATHAGRGFWNADKRLLHDLQRV